MLRCVLKWNETTTTTDFIPFYILIIIKCFIVNNLYSLLEFIIFTKKRKGKKKRFGVLSPTLFELS